MKNDICLETIMHNYIMYKANEQSFNISENSYKEDIFKLAKLSNKDVSTFSFESKKDIYKVLNMINLNDRAVILKSFLENHYLNKYELHHEFTEFFSKQIWLIKLKNYVVKFLKKNNINEICYSIINLQSCSEYLRSRMQNWINIETSLTNLNIIRSSCKLIIEFKKEFIFDLFENTIISNNINIVDFNELLSLFGILEKSQKLLKFYLEKYIKIHVL